MIALTSRATLTHAKLGAMPGLLLPPPHRKDSRRPCLRAAKWSTWWGTAQPLDPAPLTSYTRGRAAPPPPPHYNHIAADHVAMRLRGSPPSVHQPAPLPITVAAFAAVMITDSRGWPAAINWRSEWPKSPATGRAVVIILVQGPTVRPPGGGGGAAVDRANGTGKWACGGRWRP